jgi:hypothetical protein
MSCERCAFADWPSEPHVRGYVRRCPRSQNVRRATRALEDVKIVLTGLTTDVVGGTESAVLAGQK